MVLGGTKKDADGSLIAIVPLDRFLVADASVELAQVLALYSIGFSEQQMEGVADMCLRDRV